EPPRLDHLATDRRRQGGAHERAHVVAECDFVGREAKVHGAASDLVYLEQPRRAHAAADAHGDDGAPGAAAPSFDHDMAGHPRSAHAKGMADRDRGAVDIETVLGDAQPVAAVEYLARKCFVEFPQIDIADIEALA